MLLGHHVRRKHTVCRSGDRIFWDTNPRREEPGLDVEAPILGPSADNHPSAFNSTQGRNIHVARKLIEPLRCQLAQHVALLLVLGLTIEEDLSWVQTWERLEDERRECCDWGWRLNQGEPKFNLAVHPTSLQDCLFDGMEPEAGAAQRPASGPDGVGCTQCGVPYTQPPSSSAQS
eukprot:TRINITY_DN28305_c0_g1_i1.p1 TRINITY_DN28305_c0_g1~~TRINITY_DN28305_c0_g1_i1.p1  ORF type:complete len:175 (+),score=19.08 TRINITY_DN28305_c0_g1_i1:303-827(+)